MRIDENLRRGAAVPARVVRVAGGLLVFAVCAAASAAQDTPPPIEVHKSAGPIRVDGDLSDPGWKDAAVIEKAVVKPSTTPGVFDPGRVSITWRA